LDLPQQLEPLILKKNEPESFCMFLALSKGATPNVEQASTAFTHQVANELSSFHNFLLVNLLIFIYILNWWCFK
jgi:hypothetical protein